jgi:hypothetical protein
VTLEFGLAGEPCYGVRRNIAVNRLQIMWACYPVWERGRLARTCEDAGETPALPEWNGG